NKHGRDDSRAVVVVFQNRRPCNRPTATSLILWFEPQSQLVQFPVHSCKSPPTLLLLHFHE
uniref:Uncharacterized protein n=1 Tax=Ciona intestinalis TaxID=7719 RepID=H2XSJ7_CIOIN